MKRGLRFIVLLSIMLSWRAAAEEVVDPVLLLRPLRAIQDQIAQGNAKAGEAARSMLGRIGDELARLDDHTWREARNVRAAVIFVLSGGDPRILKRIMAAGTAPEEEHKLIEGALAYAEGKGGEAVSLLAGISALKLDPALGGHVALVQAELIAKSDPARALGLLDEARLLSPGTLVEEAALRRQISIVTAAGHPERFEALTSQYLRRFPKSLYAGTFKQQFAAELAGRKGSIDPASLAKLEAALSRIDVTEQRDVYLRIATEAIARGRMEIVRFASGKARGLAPSGGTEYMRAATYEAAALMVTGEFEKGLAQLQAVDRTKLQGEDVELLDAALAVAEHIRQLPAASGPSGAPPPGASASPRMETVRQAIARVDELLEEAHP